MLDTSTYLPKLKEFEGSYSYMYADTAGKITVGVGKMLPDAAAAQKLGFVRRPNPAANPSVLGGPAAPEDIQADFDSVNSQPAGKLASYYRQFTKLDLPDDAIDSLLNTVVQGCRSDIVASFPDFDSYPPEACAAIFDMTYNLGIGKLLSEFPKFCRAVKSNDWATAANECQRGGIGDTRNAWTKTQLETADANSKAAQDKTKEATTP